jgi:putative glutamine amidotransferase
MLRGMPPAAGRSPRIVVTLAAPEHDADPVLAARKNALYVDSITRHGGTAIPLDATASESMRAGAFASMAGLMLTGGSDLEPTRYGRAEAGSSGVDPLRDALEAAAWAAADARALPVLGICRGLQAMNVFAGGTLTQHVDGHESAPYGRGVAHQHPLRLAPGSRLARILSPTNAGGSVLTVNSYHHQAVRPSDLAPVFVASGLTTSPAGDLVEALEAPSGPFRIGVQCHPERTESTPRAFERLFAFFVDACRGPIAGR